MQFCKALVLALLISPQSFGQKLLFHKNNFKEAIYQTGDVISFRLKNDKSKITGQIVRFEDSLIVFQDYRINPKEISEIYIDRKTRLWFIVRYKYQFMLPAIGGGYLLLELANSGEANKNTLLFGGSMITAGILARIVIPNRIKIKGKRRLSILK